jgi:hypothetical protein
VTDTNIETTLPIIWSNFALKNLPGCIDEWMQSPAKMRLGDTIFGSCLEQPLLLNRLRQGPGTEQDG